MPATKAPGATPRIFVWLTDREIPERVVSYYEAPLNRPVLRRPLADDERVALEQRAADLRASLAPCGEGARARVGGAISRMFNGYPNMQRRTDAEAVAILDGYFSTLRERPAWAIIEACQIVREGRFPEFRSFAPSEAALNRLVADVTAPYRAQLQAIDNILVAKTK